MKECKVIEADIYGNYTISDFQAEVSANLKDGYEVSSTNCCVVGANEDGSFSRFQAILVKQKEKKCVTCIHDWKSNK